LIEHKKNNISSQKKSLKIPKGLSEAVNQRRTDNKMAKREVQKVKQQSTNITQKTKDQTTIYKHYTEI
jgi:outer membrane murein-binding lipoprotein Lpp